MATTPKADHEPPRISTSEAAEWLVSGRPWSREIAVVADKDGHELGVLLSPQEYAAMLAFMQVANDPKKQALHRSRIQKIRSGQIASFTNFFGPAER
jgi:hypothetical protein